MKYRLLSWINDLWYSKFRVLTSFILYLTAKILFRLSSYNLSRRFCAMSLRYGVRSPAIFLFKRILDRHPYTKEDSSTGVSIEEAAGRSIIVKWPEYEGATIEKGIIIVTFTKTFSYFIRSINIAELQKHFFLVLEPSWSGYADPDIFFFYKKHSDVVVSCSEIEDRILLNCFHETFRPVTFGASDWVNFERFSPINGQKTYDSVYIANTKPIKRVKRYLDAIKNIVDSGLLNYKALLICASWGGSEDLVKQLVSRYSLENNVELKFSLGTDELIKYLCKSKTNVLLSFKEGSNRSLFEAIFCDVPVVCLSENVGVNKSYINEFTGILVPDLLLEEALSYISSNFSKFTPRSWAMENISPKASTAKLLNLLYSDNTKGNVLVKTNNPEVCYFDLPEINHWEYTKGILEVFAADNPKTSNLYSELVLNFKARFNTSIADL